MTMRTNKEILAVVNQMVSDGQVSQDVAEKYFPELRENKDEIMMRIIMNALIKVPYSELDGLIPDTIRIWLEGKIKQGEKKPVDKAEPKFKVGDWVVSPNGVYWHIDAINNNRYEVSSTDGACADWPLNTSLYHLWTIQDTKDGDVLVTNSNIIFIFKYLDEGGIIAFRASCTENSGVYFPKIKERLCDQDAHPATQKQRDTLMKAMADAGYTFDFEKKELKKIEQKPIECVEWNEEDINMIDWLIRCCEKEHEKLCNDKYGHQDIVSDLKRDCRKKWDWLESLKNRVAPQKQWKPSNELIMALDGICSYIRNRADWEISKEMVSDLYKLSEQLKKLKG